MAYHPHGNGQVECFHQTIIWMIGKMSKDKKVHWYDHLSEMTQAYNSTRKVVTGYSLHYLMFGRLPHLPIDFFFPTIWGSNKPCKVPDFILKLRDCLKEALHKAQHQAIADAECQKHYYDKSLSVVVLDLGDTVLLKSDACVGKRKINDQWDDKTYTVIWQIVPDAPLYEIRDDSGKTQVIHHNRLLFRMR